MLRADELQKVWYGGTPPSFGLRVLSVLYGGLSALRRGLYRAGLLRRVRLPVPVLVIGNVSVGGTGKTPLAIALVEALRRAGLRPGVISRGYGGAARGPLRVRADSTPAEVGDEPCLIVAQTGVPLAVGRDRAAAARLLLATGEVDVLIADDGLQHYRLCRDVEIGVIDGTRRFGNGRLLPAGPLREPASRLDEVDWRVCNGGIAGPQDVPMHLALGAAVRVDGGGTRALADFGDGPAHAVAGIGHPARFFAALRDRGIAPIEHAFPDHHAYTARDLDFGDDLPVLMTQKDAVKCRAFAAPNWWYVPARAELPADFLSAVVERVRALQGKGGTRAA